MSRTLADDRDLIDSEACAWLVRIEENGLDHHGQAEFDAWLAADPRHETTYYEMRETWADISELRDLAELVPLRDPITAEQPTPVRARRWGRISVAGLGAVAAALLAILVVPGHLFGTGQHYTTELAETRIVTLPDGSSVTLGAKSSIQVKYSDRERRVVLAGGEAFFDVVHNASRPFLVEAGKSVVRDIGTKFDVNLGDGSVRVSVLEGLVQVSRSDRAAISPPKLLRAGQRTELSFAAPVAVGVTAPPPSDIVAMPAQAPGAWREGRLVFDNVRLADLAGDVNRYYAPGVKLASPEVGDLRITASFKTSEIPAFMSALSATLPVRTEHADNGTYTVSPAQP
ncbi:MAG: anti-FecI sigma factor, FecR [Bradyrhizobium sp.]|nr:anti-FecI sigma factor, FecR [Bradyrhizobium sp.]